MGVHSAQRMFGYNWNRPLDGCHQKTAYYRSPRLGGKGAFFHLINHKAANSSYFVQCHEPRRERIRVFKSLWSHVKKAQSIRSHEPCRSEQL